jgi:hypothetical protein
VHYTFTVCSRNSYPCNLMPSAEKTGIKPLNA